MLLRIVLNAGTICITINLYEYFIINDNITYNKQHSGCTLQDIIIGNIKYRLFILHIHMDLLFLVFKNAGAFSQIAIEHKHPLPPLLLYLKLISYFHLRNQVERSLHFEHVQSCIHLLFLRLQFLHPFY